MRKILAFAIVCVFLFGGCGNNNKENSYIESAGRIAEDNYVESTDGIAEDNYTESADRIAEDDYIDSTDVMAENDDIALNKEELLQNGYSEILDIAYGKIESGGSGEKPTVYLVYCGNAPEISIYLLGQVMQLMNRVGDDYDLIITWDGQEYLFNDETTANFSMENVKDLFPADWHGIFESGFTIKELISESSADAVDEEAENLVFSYLEERNVDIADGDEKAEDGEEENENIDEEDDGSNREVIDSFYYEYDANNHVVVSILEDKETKQISVFAIGEYEENNLGLLQNNFVNIWMYPLVNSYDFSAALTIGENTYAYIKYKGILIYNDVPLENFEDISEDYMELNEEMKSELRDFYVEYGIAEKTYNTLIYEDERVKIAFKGIGEKGVEFSVENLTDFSVTIQARSLAINGVSTNSIIMSDNVAPKSTGTVVAKCNDFSQDTIVERISGELRVISDGNWKSYSAVFSDIEIE